MTSEIILYDLSSRGSHPKCWSLNPWKARLALNYKGLPYRTEWLEYPDIAPQLQAHGVPPNDKETNPVPYSCPAAKLPDGTFVMDSRAIAEALDKLQPQPSLHTEDSSEVLDRTQAAVLGIRNTLGPIAIPRVPDLLNPRSADYFHETRAKRFGMSLAEVAKSDEAGEQAWENAEPYLRELGSILKGKGEGAYILGREVSFADFIVAGLWAFLEKLDRDGDLFGRVKGYDGEFGRHFDACREWLQRDD